MRLAEDQLRGHLLEDESVRAFTSGRLLEESIRGPTAVGLTDRRLLCVSQSSEFVAVAYDAVCSVRSRRRSQVRYRPGDGPNRTLRLAGGLLALALLAVGVSLAASVGGVQAVMTVGLAGITVAVAVAVESVRKRPGADRTYQPVFVGAGILGLAVIVGFGLLSASAAASLFVVVTLGGLALAGYVARYREEIGTDGVGLERYTETHLRINTVDGETVRIAVDAETDIDRELGACVHHDRGPDGSDAVAAEPSLVRSPSD